VRLLRIGVRVGLALAALVVLYVAVTFVQVWWASRQDDASPADAIVVAGAAQWNGRPSPCCRPAWTMRRSCGRDGVAPVIVVTGGKQAATPSPRGSPVMTTSGAGRAGGGPAGGGGRVRHLHRALATQNILEARRPRHRRGARDEPLPRVPGPSHREEVGLSAHVSPSQDASSLRSLARETAGVSVGRIVGYRRLSNWTS